MFGKNASILRVFYEWNTEQIQLLSLYGLIDRVLFCHWPKNIGEWYCSDVEWKESGNEVNKKRETEKPVANEDSKV